MTDLKAKIEQVLDALDLSGESPSYRADAVTTLAAFAREVQQDAQPTWQPMAAGPPKDGSWIVIATSWNPYRRLAVHWDDGEWRDDDDQDCDGIVDDATHYYVLPQPPSSSPETRTAPKSV